MKLRDNNSLDCYGVMGFYRVNLDLWFDWNEFLKFCAHWTHSRITIFIDGFRPPTAIFLGQLSLGFFNTSKEFSFDNKLTWIGVRSREIWHDQIWHTSCSVQQIEMIVLLWVSFNWHIGVIWSPNEFSLVKS